MKGYTMKLTEETIKRINNWQDGKVLSARMRGIIAEILIKKGVLEKPKVSNTKCR